LFNTNDRRKTAAIAGLIVVAIMAGCYLAGGLILSRPIFSFVYCPAGSGLNVAGKYCFDAKGIIVASRFGMGTAIGMSLAVGLVGLSLWSGVVFGVAYTISWRSTAAHLSPTDIQTILDWLKGGHKPEATAKVSTAYHWPPYKIEVFLNAIQTVPAGQDPADYAYKTAVRTPAPEQHRPRPIINSRIKANWLPTECTHCGAAISESGVKWLSVAEAQCPYCAGYLRPRSS
jgi:hypothetical protein